MRRRSPDGRLRPTDPGRSAILARRLPRSCRLRTGVDGILLARFSTAAGKGGIPVAHFSRADTAESGILVQQLYAADTGQVHRIVAPPWWSSCWSRSC